MKHLPVLQLSVVLCIAVPLCAVAADSIEDTGLVPNGDFSSWKAGQDCPDGWSMNAGRGGSEQAPFVLERTRGGVRQVWQKSDGADSILDQFGVTLSGLKPDTFYKLEVCAEACTGRTPFVAAWGIAGKDVAKLTKPGIAFFPTKQALIFETFFNTRTNETVRLVSLCQAEAPPVSVVWRFWRLTEVPEADWMSSVGRAHVNLADGGGDAGAEYLGLSSEEDLQVLDAALTEAFGGMRPAGVRARAERICAYVAQKLKGGNSTSGVASAILSEGQAICGGRATVMTALCRRAGIPARKVQLRNIGGIMNTHVLVEVLGGGDWLLYDPSYAAFFCADRELKEENIPLSARRLLENPSLARNCFQFDVPRMTGAYSGHAPPKPLEDEQAKEFYRQAFAESFPNRSHWDGSAASFPVSLDLSQRDELWLGTIDGEASDVCDHRLGETFERYRGDLFIGVTPQRVSFHTLVMRVPKPGTCRVTYHFVGERPLANIGAIELKGAVVSTTASDDRSWSMECLVQDAEGVVLLDNRYLPEYPTSNAAVIDAIHAEYLGAPADKQE